MARIRRLLLALTLVISTATTGVITAAQPAFAQGQVGTAQITLNPGGGVRTDGTDGLRFTINNGNTTGAYIQGQDAVFYRNTQQYCCTAGAPMLNIGGTLFGQAGPAYSSTNWTSLTVLSTGGSTATGALTATTGDASAKVRYIATKNSRQYVMDRTVSYTYPNDYITETFDFTIPAGNTDVVKFFQGGDTAPGGSDIGYGIMLTSPVRTVISLNTSSQIQFGYREVSGSKAFDGATSQHYYTPFPIVQSGGNLGYVVTGATHDAGLMVQWNLGSTPGTQSATMEEFVNKQGTNLSAAFDRTNTTPGVPVIMNISVVNTVLTAATGLGYTITLPSGTAVGSGTVTNGCGGTLSAPLGATSVTLSGGSVGSGTNCVMAVPVGSSTYGTYTLSAANVSGLSNLTNNVGTSSFFVPLAPAWEQSTINDLTVAVPSTASVGAQGAPAPTYSVTGGSLPAGLTLNPTTGALTGTPTTAGAYSFTITATNSGGTAAQTFTGSVLRGTPGLSGSASPTSVAYGGSVTLQATGLPAGATGTVTFTSGALTLCSVTLPTTSCTAPTTLTPGSYPVDAAYSGNTNWTPRTETIASFEVDQAESSVSGELGASEISFGSSTTATATVTPSGATGTVTVSSGELVLCTITLPGTSCTISDELAPGEYPIVLTYSGDELRQASSGEAGTLTVVRATPSPTPEGTYTGVYGTPTPLTLPGLPTNATGTVSFIVGETVLCSYDLSDDPQSCDAPADLAAGEYTMHIRYSGDGNFAPTENVVTLIIDKASTTIGSPESVTGTYGTATAVSSSSLPENATGLGRVSYGDETLCTFDVATESSCDLPADWPAGEYTLVVSYDGDDNYLGSSTLTTLIVEQAETTLEAPESVTTSYNAPVFISVAGLPEDATGTITIVGGPNGTECSFDVAVADGCETTGTTPAGTWPLTITYSGDGNYLGSTTSSSLIVERSSTSISTESVVGGIYGTPVTIEVADIPEDADGTVTISYEGPDGTVVLCTFSALNETSCDLPANLPAGSYELDVSYSGDSNYAPSSSWIELEIDPADTAIDTEDSFTTTYGTAAVVNVVNLPEDATGTVDVIAGSPAGRLAGPSEVLCSFDVTVTDHCAAPADLTAGTYQAYVIYLGDNNYNPSIDTTSIVIIQGVTGVVASDMVTGVFGTPVTFDVSGLPEGATGTVTVTVGDTVICTFEVPGESSCEGAGDLPAGSYPLYTTYSGDQNFSGSAKEATLEIAQAPSSISGPAAIDVTHGTPATFPVSGLPEDGTGIVIVSSGDMVLCTFTVPGATSCDGPADLPGGSYAVTVSYSGDDNYLGSSFESVLTVLPEAVAPAAPPALGTTAGSNTEFEITGLPADATGTIQVLSGSTVLCTITLPATTCSLGAALAAGSYDLTVMYSGDTNYAPSSTTTSLIVGTLPTSGTASLSYTGVDVATWSMIALALLLLGTTLVLAGRRTRPSEFTAAG